jgi:hypothetical protein
MAVAEVWSCSAQEAVAAPMPDHRVCWTVEAGEVRAVFSCEGDRRSRCHLGCAQACGAEQWPCGADGEGLAHRMAEGADCHVVLFLSHDSAEEVYAGLPTGPRDALIEATWEGDFYAWQYAAQPTGAGR